MTFCFSKGEEGMGVGQDGSTKVKVSRIVKKLSALRNITKDFEGSTLQVA